MSEQAQPSIHIGAKAQQSVQCAQCGQAVAPGQFFTFKGKDNSDLHLCGGCRDKVEGALRQETEGASLGAAAVVGLAAGAVAAGLWYLIVTLTGVAIGYMAIGVGFLVGKGVWLGAGRKRGAPLQLLAAGITVGALFVAKYFTFLKLLSDYLAQHGKLSPGSHVVLSPLHPAFLGSLLSPMGLLMWAIAVYVAFSVPKARSI